MRLATFYFALIVGTFCVCSTPTFAQDPPVQTHISPGLATIREASTIAIDCGACPRALSKAGKTAYDSLLAWSRFRLVDDPKRADLVLIISSNPYLGDYVTLDGPDKRQVRIETTIMTVVDPHTGAELWADSRQWGSFRVTIATKSLIEELRGDMEAEAKHWTPEDVLRCTGVSDYLHFAHLTPEEVLT
jgi:hypothetical protein